MRKLLMVGFLVTLMAGTVSSAMRPTPEYLKSAVIYQLVLRNFTREGSFQAATKMLEHVRSAGVDAIYLTPFVEMDRDMDKAGWSPRQRGSGFHTPKNPYRIANYDKIDPEYGNDADFKAFNDKAHQLGMKVYIDLVYLHCGPNNVLKDMFPDAFQKNPNGTVRMTIWRFPYVNFQSKAVRKYLIDSMLHWMALGCDGFRCDVGDEVPIDFWVEAVKACQAVKPDLVMINEGMNVEWLEKAFDAGYAWPYSFAIREYLEPRSMGGGNRKINLKEKMDKARKYEAKIPTDSLMFCFMDNHDTANDDLEFRFDRTLPVEAGNAAFTLLYLRKGLPLIYNGNEIADNALNTFFAPVEDAARARKTVDWGRALQPDGQKRLAHLRKLYSIRHGDAIFANGSHRWIESGETQGVVAFVRELKGRKILVTANLSPKTLVGVDLGVKPKSGVAPIITEDATFTQNQKFDFSAYGYFVAEIE